MATATKSRLLTREFILICSCYFAFFVSFYLLLPILPLYVVQLGGSESSVGIVVGSFTISSVIVRPFIGRAVDERGKRFFMLAGTIIFFIVAILYNFATSIPLLIALRAFHGLGLAAVATAASAYVAEIAPPARRGEAMGYFGASTNVAMAVGPNIGLFVLGALNFTALFLVSAGIALASILFAAPVPEPPRDTAVVPSRRSPLFSVDAAFPSVVVFLVSITYGALVTFLPLFAESREIGDFALFFTVYSIVLILFRLFSGRLSDLFGRTALIIPGLIGIAAAMVLMIVTRNLAVLLLTAALYGVAWGAVLPAIMALVTDLAPSNERGACMATFTAAFDLGIGVGAIVMGFLVQATDFSVMFIATAILAALSLAVYLIGSHLGLAEPARGLSFQTKGQNVKGLDE